MDTIKVSARPVRYSGQRKNLIWTKLKLVAIVIRQAIRERQKNDATDDETICEALTRPTIRIVPAKSEEQQSVLMLQGFACF